MTAYVNMVGDFVRARFGGDDAGQNMVETALIIGTISLVIVGAFLMSGVKTSMGDLAAQVACVVQGANWTAGAGNAVGACT